MNNTNAHVYMQCVLLFTINPVKYGVLRMYICMYVIRTCIQNSA